jgi:nucleotide-binding universal stress UspA family protein
VAHTPSSMLVAVDFGDASARAVALAGFMAERHGAATLRLLHAESVEAPPYFTHGQIETLERQRQTTRAQAEQFLLAYGREHTRWPFATVVSDHAPVEAILRESMGADLVVMGTHGRHGPKRWWLGSVAERVLREVTRPLLIVRAEMADPVESLFHRVRVHAALPLVGASTRQYARALSAGFDGEVSDVGHGPIESALAGTDATLLVVAMPAPRTAKWLSDYGEPLVRSSVVPILFIPEASPGASS